MLRKTKQKKFVSIKNLRRQYKAIIKESKMGSNAVIIVVLVLVFLISLVYLMRNIRNTETNDIIVKEEMVSVNDDDIKDVSDVSDISDVDVEGHAQIFYYPWYGNIKNDGKYIHWNHDILPHWNENVNKQYKIGKEYDPNYDEIGANYYPYLGTYSSKDINVIRQHFKWLLSVNVTVIIASWHSPNNDAIFAEKDKITTNNLDILFQVANEYDIKICIHMEPYDNRNAETTYKDIEYVINKYGKLKGFYRSKKHNNKHIFYVYDSYKMNNNQWKQLFINKNSEYYIRNNENLDHIFLGLYLDKKSESHLINSGFDGFYTYFASNAFTFGSNPNNWEYIYKWSIDNNLLFIPSLGPGYIDTRVRPWNDENTKNRNNGQYYQYYWDKINDINIQYNTNKIEYISITSFNEWHEGTQIEPCIPKTSKNGFKYMDFNDDGGPFFYLDLTKKFVKRFLDNL